MLINRRMDTQILGYTVYFYNRKLFINKEGQTIDAWINLKNIMLREGSQNKRGHTIWFHVHEVQEWSNLNYEIEITIIFALVGRVKNEKGH